MSAARVSVIVVTWNGIAYLADCLTALAAQTHRPTEVVVVDNASCDGTAAFVRRAFPHVTLIENSRNVGFALGNVQALPHCRGEYIALVNNDTRAAPNWLANLVTALKDDQRAAGASGAIVSLDDHGQLLCTTPKIDPWSGRAIGIVQPAPACHVDYLAGNSMVMRRSVIDQIGFLDADYVAYYEETDWCARALRAGYHLLYVPSAVIAHREQGSTSSAYHDYYMTRNQLRFVLKQVESRRLPVAVALSLLALARDAAGAARRDRAPALAPRARALTWNLVHLLDTVAARRRDSARLPSPPRPLLATLPLRQHASDGHGGLIPPIAGGQPATAATAAPTTTANGLARKAYPPAVAVRRQP